MNAFVVGGISSGSGVHVVVRIDCECGLTFMLMDNDKMPACTANNLFRSFASVGAIKTGKTISQRMAYAMYNNLLNYLFDVIVDYVLVTTSGIFTGVRVASS